MLGRSGRSVLVAGCLVMAFSSYLFSQIDYSQLLDFLGLPKLGAVFCAFQAIGLII
jgi:hypothetical protein